MANQVADQVADRLRCRLLCLSMDRFRIDQLHPETRATRAGKPIDHHLRDIFPKYFSFVQQSSAHALYATFIRLLSAFFFVDPEVFYPEQVDFEQGNTRVFSQFNKTTVQHAQGVNTNTETLLIWRTIERHRAFTMLSNYILSDKRLHDAPTFETTVTYITQATCDFLHHSVQVCRRFDGPISLAVYSPGSEFLLTVKLIFFLRQCTHPCVRQNITWHLVFDDRHRPDLLDVQQTWQEFLHKSGFKMAAIDCNESFASFFNRLKNKHFSRNQSFPINLLRNFARKHARSRYGLVSDIDLYPSLNVVSMFRRLLDQERDGRLEIVDSSKPHVYVLPVYEVKTGDVKTPKTKDELVEMLNTGSAIALSKRKRESRHKFVDQESWINATIKPGELNIFQKVKPKPTGWEPFFIGTNDDPFFDEKLTWGGRQDRTAQVSFFSGKSMKLILV